MHFNINRFRNVEYKFQNLNTFVYACTILGQNDGRKHIVLKNHMVSCQTSYFSVACGNLTLQQQFVFHGSRFGCGPAYATMGRVAARCKKPIPNYEQFCSFITEVFHSAIFLKLISFIKILKSVFLRICSISFYRFLICVILFIAFVGDATKLTLNSSPILFLNKLVQVSISTICCKNLFCAISSSNVLNCWLLAAFF